MLRNFFTIALRNIMRHKGYSALNILGLAVGFACAFMIFIWMHDELQVDQFHENSDRLYSVMRHSTFGGQRGTTPSMPKPLDDALRSDWAEIEYSALISWEMTSMLARGNDVYRLDGHWAGVDFFRMFSFPLVVGDPATVLEVPESIVLSESATERFFGTDWRNRNDVVGSTIRLDNRTDLTVTGVFENVPAASSLQFEYIIPIEEYIRRNEWVEAWNNNGLRLNATLVPGADVAAFNARIKDIIDQHNDSYESDVFLYPFADRYLHGDFENGVLVGGRIEYVRMFGIVALLIILIASINFMNLATARSSQRAREIGVRKTVGATRKSLAFQFIGESLLKAMIAFVLAAGLVMVLLPAFNSLTQKSVTLGTLDPALWALFAGLALVTGLLAGSYPALYLSSFSVVGVFDKRSGSAGKGSGLRKALVVAQFAMSIVLIVGTLTVYRQLEFIRTKDLGMNRENVAMVRLEGGIANQYEAFRNQLMQVEGVTGVTTANNNPLQIGNDTIGVEWDGKDPDDNTLFWNAAVGHDFVETMGIGMAAGRSFSRDFASDSTNYLVNWQAAEAMGMDDPVGQQISFWGTPGTIVGVMEDFHLSSMYRPITPVIFRLQPDNTSILFVRMDGARTKEAMAGLTDVYKQFNPEYAFTARFLDEQFDEMYRSEAVLGSLSNVFAFVAIFIACLGLFGLASYTAERRTKEIGVRKVLGASVPGIVGLLSRDYLILVGGAFLVAAPVAYLVMNKWLDEFEYHTDLGVGLLVMAGLATLAIAWLTVSYQSIRAALANPADSLRTE
ncbi:MAG: ABC transporter permease [Rhodothermales bacterium]